MLLTRRTPCLVETWATIIQISRKIDWLTQRPGEAENTARLALRKGSQPGHSCDLFIDDLRAKVERLDVTLGTVRSQRNSGGRTLCNLVFLKNILGGV